MKITHGYTWLKIKTVRDDLRRVVLPIILTTIIVALVIAPLSPVLAGGSTCTGAVTVPLANATSGVGGYVNKSTHPDDWYRVYMPSGVLDIRIENDFYSSTDLIFTLWEHCCTAGCWVGSWSAPKGSDGWINDILVTEGYYYFGFSHDGSESDNCSFIFRVRHEEEVCSITVTSPNGGENWELGSTHSISWTSSSAGSNVKIELYKGTSYYRTIISSTPNDGSYSWTVPSSYDDYSSYRIKITDTGDSSCYDYSNSYFALSGNVPPALALTGPSSDITVNPGDTVTIQWSDSDPDDNAIIALARDSNCSEGGHTWLTVGLTEDPDGSGDQYYWDTTGVPEGTYRIWGMIYDGTNPEVYSCAPGSVTIRPCSITVTSPNGGEDWELESTHSITWTSSNAGSNVKIELCKGTSYYKTITSSTSNDGSYSWAIPSSYDDYSSYRIKITDTGDSSCYDYSDGYFALSGNVPPTLDLTGPSSDITVDPGDTVTIQWSDSDPDDNATIALARDSNCAEGGHTWLTVSLTENPDGSGDQYYWDTTGVPEGTYRIWGMIYDGTNPEVYSCAPVQ